MENQEKILKISLVLFFKYGIKRVTMDDIAKEIGISKKSIYFYYKDKDDLVTQLCDNKLREHELKFDEIKLTAKNPIHEMMLISVEMTQIMQNINPIFFLDLQKNHLRAFERFQKFKLNIASKIISTNLNWGIKDGFYQSNLDVDFVSTYRLAQIDMIMFGNYFSFDKVSFVKTHEFILNMFVYGVSSLKGHKLINNYKKVKNETD